jgi:hypothetical protein
MATTQGKADDPKAPDAKSSEAPRATDARPASPSAVVDEGDQKSNASDMLSYRDDHVGAKEAAVEANKQVAKDDAEAVKNAVPAEHAAFNPNPYNQVPQEGALVETPPQPVPPSYTEAELKEMDHAPAGLREPSVAAGSDDTDQTVHPKSRVDDPTKPL